MAEDRKARLAALAARAGRTNKMADDDQDGPAASQPPEAEPAGEEPRPAVRFRNYAPKDASLEGGGGAEAAAAAAADRPPVLGAGSSGSSSTTPATKRQRTGESTGGDGKGERTALEQALLQAKADAAAASGGGAAAAAGGELGDMAPKKVNWDLKRDVQGKVDKLERRTQRAIVELLRERLEKEAEEGDGDGGYDALD